MKKVIVLSVLTLLFSFNLNASVNPKRNFFKKNKQSEKVLVWDCEADYNFMISNAEYTLWFNLTYPPSNANSFYYSAVWSNYNTSLKQASDYKKKCLSAN